eukprot:COSAG01_NODE_30989_length_605_cov_51.430830_1_plen_28_part_01
MRLRLGHTSNPDHLGPQAPPPREETLRW